MKSIVVIDASSKLGLKPPGEGGIPATTYASAMALALVTGRGPNALTNILELKPPVEETNVVLLGYRDSEASRA